MSLLVSPPTGTFVRATRHPLGAEGVAQTIEIVGSTQMPARRGSEGVNFGDLLNGSRSNWAKIAIARHPTDR